MKFECDIDAYKFRRAMDEALSPRPNVRELARNHPAAIQVLRVHRLRERAKTLFPGSTWNQAAWVEARLRLRQIGCRRPRVRIGGARTITGESQ